MDFASMLEMCNKHSLFIDNITVYLTVIQKYNIFLDN